MSFYGKVMFTCKFTLSLKIFIIKRNKIQLGFNNMYPENNLLMCAKVMLNMKKTIQMSDFIPNGVGKILYVKAFY